MIHELHVKVREYEGSGARGSSAFERTPSEDPLSPSPIKYNQIVRNQSLVSNGETTPINELDNQRIQIKHSQSNLSSKE